MSKRVSRVRYQVSGKKAIRRRLDLVDVWAPVILLMLAVLAGAVLAR